MLIDSQPFRDIAIRNLMAAGLPQKTAEHCAEALVAEAATLTSTEIQLPVSVHIAYDDSDAQRVYVVSKGEIDFWAMPAAEFQPLARAAVDPAQYALLDQMEQILLRIDMTISNSNHSMGPMFDPDVIALQHRYNAMRSASLAINPVVHASIADPETYRVCAANFEAAFGTLPTGHMTHEQMCRNHSMLDRLAG